MEHISRNSMIIKVKEHIKFHFLLREIQLYSLDWICSPRSIKIKDKSITHDILRIQDKDSIMCGFYCIPLIEYMLLGKAVLDYNNLFYPNEYEKNDKLY